jgi:hypothetical protein
MSRFRNSAVAILGVAILFASTSGATLQASTLEEVTVFTFKGPVQVPGRILPAGKYLFKLDQTDGDLNVVEIKNQRQNKVYGIFLVKPKYHVGVPSRPAITFEDRAPGTPLAIKAWLYPGDEYAYEFIYK